jgi:hypothetical protein
MATNKTKPVLELENKELLAKIALLEKNIVDASEKSVKNVAPKESERALHPDEYISVISLCPHILNLKVGRSSNAEQYRFEEFGEMSRILYRDLAKIIESNKKFTRGGYYYILDKRVVRNHGLDDSYSKILLKEEIERLFVEKPDQAGEMFSESNAQQKKLISEIIINKIAKGEVIDMNFVRLVGDDVGRDLVEDAKSFDILKK